LLRQAPIIRSSGGCVCSPDRFLNKRLSIEVLSIEVLFIEVLFIEVLFIEVLFIEVLFIEVLFIEVQRACPLSTPAAAGTEPERYQRYESIRILWERLWL